MINLANSLTVAYNFTRFNPKENALLKSIDFQMTALT